MLKPTLFFIVISLSLSGWSQEELINTYTSKSSVAGGTEDGGESITTRFVFVAQETITLLNVFSVKENITLGQGDTLILLLNSFRPYRAPAVDKNTDLSAYIKSEFSSVKYKGLDHVTINYEDELKIVLRYKYGRKKSTANIKDTIDAHYQSYAP